MPQEVDASAFAELGVAIAAPDEPPADDGFGVWAVNWESFRAFLACQTQWRIVAGLAGSFWTGLDYAAVDIVLRRRFPDVRFEDLQTLEQAALEALAEARDT